MSTATWIRGDVRVVLPTLPAGSVDLVCTSPPFWKQRGYLPAGHPDKAAEIGQEASPAAFLDVLLQLTVEWRRLLAPHGSIAIELGDTMAGSGGAGGDYNEGGFREGQPTWDGSARALAGNRKHERVGDTTPILNRHAHKTPAADGVLAKSHCMIPEAYRFALVWGINPFTGQPSPAGQWIVRNVVDWCRRNPTPGDDGDKFRRATSDIVCATLASNRWWDGYAVREPAGSDTHPRTAKGVPLRENTTPKADQGGNSNRDTLAIQHAGDGTRPLYDWWDLSSDPYDGWTPTSHRVPCGPHDGGERTTSPDCPVHADLPGQLPKALRDAHAGSRSTRTPRSGDRRDQEQLFGSAPTDPLLEPPTVDGSSDSLNQSCAPAASPRSTASSRTDLAPATTSPDTPSAQTDDRTERTPASPESGDAMIDSLSRTAAVVAPGEAPPAELDRSSRTDAPPSDVACTCSYFKTITKRTSHYAVWPPEVARRLIVTMCPTRVCTTCGEPQRRITRTSYVKTQETSNPSAQGLTPGVKGGGADPTYSEGRAIAIETLGWTTCGHDTWRPGMVLDPFAGSGTTGSVATGNSRDAILIDLDDRNLDLAYDRVGPLFLEVAEPEPSPRLIDLPPL